MRNAENTKLKIITTSANLFNTQGYKATSISDITKATGFTKGAIYRHFKSKQDLENQALLQLSQHMFESIAATVRDAKSFTTKFEAIFNFFENYMGSPLYQGGCPLLNAATEADDANPEMRLQVLQMLDDLKKAIVKLIENGKINKQIEIDANPEYYATIIISTLEGAIMMSRLENSAVPINIAIDHLKNVINGISLKNNRKY